MVNSEIRSDLIISNTQNFGKNKKLIKKFKKQKKLTEIEFENTINTATFV